MHGGHHHPGAAKGKHEALISVMNGWYQQLREMETEYGIHASDDDLRPRIEYFHDAVRLLSYDPNAATAKQGRLTVEHLAWDLSWLRHISEKPTVKMPSWNNGQGWRPEQRGGTKQVVPLAMANTREFRMPPPNVRAELSTLYKNYTVLFAALFAETVDMNYQTRRTDMDTEVEELAQIEQMIRLVEMGQQAQQENLEQAALVLEDEQLKSQIMLMIHDKVQQRRRQRAIAAVQQIRGKMNGIDQQIAGMEKAHMGFLSGQMVLLQESKDMVKKLAGQGLNLAGQFLDAVVSAVAKGLGGGRGF